ncbi:insulin gene enhancer protein ISL-1 isoform X3 [Centruroides vittatus]|uniref:insulin gene enhancer protein ISL-1-like isoform X3 n=1 Tax=Centruroides sculpturatus TaxID=218467 RepID=UPI000C6CAD84|nr:insulin gene enhancer protein ISL-1-like isoform X3 [Centruroides sculpturatus]
MVDIQPQKKRRVSMCVGCGSQIHDQYILRVSPDLEWHAACLKCADCHQFLDETCTCFVRDGKTYCKRDYVRLFGAKCAKCNQGFSKTDFVMRARNKIYHIDCFRCETCARPLIPGDEFALREDGLFCKADNEVVEKPHITSNGTGAANGTNMSGGASGNTGLQMAGKVDNLKRKRKVSCVRTNAEPMQNNRNRDSVRPQVHKQNSEHKPTRVRTVLNEKQLHTLRTCYAANPRPDALMKEQLVEMTGLSPRVIRVWFQNKRCKDKKKSIMLKQMQQQEKDGRQLTLGSMRGVPMVASSPVRHESPIQLNPIEVQTYQPPWKTLAEYAIQPDIDPSAPHFQQLVSQMHGYGEPDPTQHVPASVPPQIPAYLAGADDPMHQPPSNLSSHLPGTPSELSSPTSE